MLRNLMMLASVGVLLAGAPVSAQPGSASETPGRTMADCMLTHVTDADEQQMKQMMIDALQDETAKLNNSAMAFGLRVLTLAQANCGLKMTDLKSPEFEAAAGLFGQAMGARIMTKAMGKIGL